MRTDRCPCNHNTSRTERVESREMTQEVVPDCEPCILISIHHKQIKAIINTDAQETRIGKNVLSMIEEKQKVNPKKKLIKTKYGMELVYTIVVKAGVHSRRKHPIEVIIDPKKILPNEMNLGLRALQILGSRITVAGQEATYRGAVRRLRKEAETGERRDKGPIPQRNQRADSMSDEDKMSFLDEEEARRTESGYVKVHNG